jgi:diguanylate cyclase (GGDEF)-like protein
MSDAGRVSLQGRLRTVFSRENQFRGAEIAIARKFTFIGWLLGTVVVFTLVPLYPMSRAIGAAGWIVFGVFSALTLAWLFFLFRHKERVSFNTLLGATYFSLAAIGSEQWLAGGLPAPYHELYPFLICTAAAVHPPRRFFPWLAVAAGVMIGPELGHTGGGQFGDLVTEFALWAGVSVFLAAVMVRLREHRHELRTGEAQAQELARVDVLTGLGNRRAFDERLAAEVARARRGGTPLSLLVCDLDNFKQINDHRGHLAGDECLRQVAGAIRTELRTEDSCFRWGGDEFVILLGDTNESGAADVADRLQAVVANTCSRPDGEPLEIKTGQSLLLDGMTGEELLARADLALFGRKDERLADGSAAGAEPSFP